MIYEGILVTIPTPRQAGILNWPATVFSPWLRRGNDENGQRRFLWQRVSPHSALGRRASSWRVLESALPMSFDLHLSNISRSTRNKPFNCPNFVCLRGKGHGTGKLDWVSTWIINENVRSVPFYRVQHSGAQYTAETWKCEYPQVSLGCPRPIGVSHQRSGLKAQFVDLLRLIFEASVTHRAY